jgi:hypothetical protein
MKAENGELVDLRTRTKSFALRVVRMFGASTVSRIASFGKAVAAL